MSRIAEAYLGDRAAQIDMFGGAKRAAALIEGVPDEVALLFEQYTFSLIKAGITHYSADAILHRIRWHHHVEKGNRDFTCNNNWTSALSRWFMAKHTQHAGFFETRVKRT